MFVVCSGNEFESFMTDSLQPRPRTRAPRVSLGGSISALVQLENLRRVPGKLHQLSITGGLLELAMYLDERAKVGLTIPVGLSTVRPEAEMLFPMRGAHGYMQPFRFTSISAEERQILEKELTERLKQSMAPDAAGHGSGFRPPRFYLESF
jgi:hypothetical protein